MSQHSAEPIKTFSIGSGSKRDELSDAERIAKRIKSDHHPHEISFDIPALLPKLVSAYEEPFADPSSLPTFLVSQFTSEHVTVALNGDGGDENFGGYVRYPILKFSRLWERMPRPIHAFTKWNTSLLRSLCKTTFLYRCDVFQETMSLPWEQRFLQYNGAFTESEKKNFYASTFANVQKQQTYEWYAEQNADARSRAASLFDQAFSMDMMHLSDCLLPKVDIASMAHSLECRSPLLDHELLELTARMPDALKLRGYQTKWLLKKALRGLLPDQTLDKKKQGFRLPMDHLLRTTLRSYTEEKLLADHAGKWDIFDKEKLRSFLHEYHNSSIDYSAHIWTLLWLDEWILQYT